MLSDIQASNRDNRCCTWGYQAQEYTRVSRSEEELYYEAYWFRLLILRLGWAGYRCALENTGFGDSRISKMCNYLAASQEGRHLFVWESLPLGSPWARVRRRRIFEPFKRGTNSIQLGSCFRSSSKVWTLSRLVPGYRKRDDKTSCIFSASLTVDVRERERKTVRLLDQLRCAHNQFGREWASLDVSHWQPWAKAKATEV